MIKLPLFQVDAFAQRPFTGNPAAVVPLQAWLPDQIMWDIARENNLSETAFYVPEQDAWQLRWFTPGGEVDLCGHATMATAHVLWTEFGSQDDELHFGTRSGNLFVRRDGEQLCLDLPAQLPTPMDSDDLAQASYEVAPLIAGLGQQPTAILQGVDWIAVYESERVIRELKPDLRQLAELSLRGVLATAPGQQHDFVSRGFFPNLEIDEDPVTGSAHTQLAPYWSERLGRSELTAAQLSARGGEMTCKLVGDRVHLYSQAVTYLRGEIVVPER